MSEIFARTDTADMAEAVRTLLRDLERTHGSGASIGECRPPLDVYETENTIQVALDVPGLGPDDLRVIARENAVIVVGEKTPAACNARDARFHLAERTFGRFARAVRLLTPVDASKATAEISNGRLRVTIPRIEDRRGRDIRVPITRV